MEWVPLFKAVFALVFVVSLIGLMGALARKYKLPERLQGMNASSQGRLKVKESIMIDSRRRLVIVARDDAEHLLLLSPENAVVVESNIVKKDA